MSKCIRRLFVMVTLMVILGVTSFGNPLLTLSATAAESTEKEENYVVIIEDQADILTDEEEGKLLDVMAQINQYGNAVFLSVSENRESQENLCHEFLGETFGVESHSTALLLFDMENRVIRIQFDGAIYDVMGEDYADTITDNVYKIASDGDYYACSELAFSQIFDVLEGKRIAQPMKHICNALLALIFSILIMFVFIRKTSKQLAPSDAELLEYIDHYCKVNLGPRMLVDKTYKGGSSSSSGGRSSGYSGSSSSSRSSSSSSRSSSSRSSYSHSSGSSHRSGGGGQHRF